jgi:hypothetical protein
MLLRFAFLFLVTGAALLGMGWLDPAGPLMLVAGAACAAIRLEPWVDAEPVRAEAAAPARALRVVRRRDVA